jgi:DNA mismatch repair ATPase MutS
MRDIVDHARPHGLVAMNESFASTNEREGADVAVPVIQALLDAAIRVVLVTHSHELAERLLRDDGHQAVFLRAQRLPDGSRTFKLAAGPPLATSFGADLYHKVFAK